MDGMDPTQFLYSGNQVYVAELYERYLDDPHSVDHRWQDFFAELQDDAQDMISERRGATWAPSDAGVLDQGALETLSEQMSAGQHASSPAQQPASAGQSGRQVREATLDSIRALMLIRAYRVRGHLKAKLDPLGLQACNEHPELDPEAYGFKQKDMDRPIFINYVLGLEQATMREIMTILDQTYCGSIGVEFMHIQDPDEKTWIQERIERIRNQPEFTVMGKKAILNRLIEKRGTLEHPIHVGDRGDNPIANRLIEGRIGKHVVHIGHVAHVPVCDVLIKVRPIPEGLGHIRHCRDIPVADVAVCDCRVRFVDEPEVDRCLEVGIGEGGINCICRPTRVGPVRIGRKGLMDLALIGVGEGIGGVEDIIHFCDFRNVPITQVLIKCVGPSEHVFHSRYI